jgi:hypothetical protein
MMPVLVSPHGKYPVRRCEGCMNIRAVVWTWDDGGRKEIGEDNGRNARFIFKESIMSDGNGLTAAHCHWSFLGRLKGIVLRPASYIHVIVSLISIFRVIGICTVVELLSRFGLLVVALIGTGILRTN